MSLPFQAASFFNLAGKTVAITGATGGIGSAIATRFAQEGARLLLIGRDQFKLSSLLDVQRQNAQQLWDEQHQALSKGGGQHQQQQNAIIQSPSQHKTFLIRSLTDMDEWKRLTDAHSPDFQEIDVLVNCAGIAQTNLLNRTREAEIGQLINTNLTGAIYGTKVVGAQMLRRKAKRDSAFTGGGCIINVSSLLGQLGTSGTSVYAATKAGLVGFTKSLAIEYAPYIRVNAVLPGFIETEMTRDIQNSSNSAEEQGKKSLKASIPMRRLGRPEEVADAVVFLTKNQYATGCILTLDGGLGSAVAGR